MKKLAVLLAGVVLSAGLLFVSGNIADAAPLPSSANTTYKVMNATMDNADATQSGVYPGNVLKYEFSMDSNAEDVKDFVLSIDVSELLMYGEIIESELGVLNGTTLTYPAYSQSAPCEHVWAFFVRVLPECEVSEAFSVTIEGASKTVKKICEEKRPALVNVGTPTIITALLLLSIVSIGLCIARKRRV